MTTVNLTREAEKIKGIAGIYFKNLTTGDSASVNAELEFHPASIVKLPIFMAIARMVSEGRASFDEKIKITYDCRVPSCGAFNAFTDEPVVDVATLCNLMITISDNTAANVLMDHYGIPVLNKEFQAMGLKGTHLERKYYDDPMQEKGYNNKAVPAEIGMLLEQLYRGEFVSCETSEMILGVLLEQQCRSKLPAYIEDYCEIGNKSGEARGIAGDVAVVLGDHPFVLCVITNETCVPETDEWMRHLGRDIFNGMSQEGFRVCN